MKRNILTIAAFLAVLHIGFKTTASEHISVPTKVQVSSVAYPTMTRVIEIVADHTEVDITDISAESDLFYDLGCDSLDICELSADCSQYYGVVISTATMNT